MGRLYLCFMKIGKYLTLDELTFSATARRLGIRNEVDIPQHLENLRTFCEKIYDPLCDHFGFRIPFTSAYRSQLLNNKIKGALRSQHLIGEAMDLRPLGRNGLTNLEMFNYIKKNLPFDQLINEFPNIQGEPSWVHVSYSNRHRKQVLTAILSGGRTKYLPYES